MVRIGNLRGIGGSSCVVVGVMDEYKIGLKRWDSPMLDGCGGSVCFPTKK